MRPYDEFDMRAIGLFNKVRNGDPDDEIEDAFGDALRAAYESGLRRAQELARQMLPSGDCFAQELDQAIDAEVAKEGR